MSSCRRSRHRTRSCCPHSSRRLCDRGQLPYKFTMVTRIAVIGAGLIGRKHLGILRDDPAFEVAGIADPSPQAEAYARENGFAYFKETEALLDKEKPDG